MYYPGSERVEACARTFEELADVYYHMPYRKEFFDKEDMEGIFREVTEVTCSECIRFKECWKKQALRTYQKMYETLELQEHVPEQVLIEKMRSVCAFPERAVRTIGECFRRERMKLYYTNRLLESQEAVADQMLEMSRLLDGILDDVLRTSEMKDPMNRKICRLFYRKGVEVKHIFLVQKKKRHNEIYITMSSRKGQIVPVKDLAGILSVVMRKKMVPARESRAMVGKEEETVLFKEETRYHMGYGVSRVARCGETVSGDNFSFMINDCGEVMMGLSDGMGSGARANEQSTRLLELLEQLLESGVSRETAMKLINSTAVYERRSYSTLDVCAVDLYSGVCEIRKLGAAPTFLYKNGEVEVVSSIRVPAGLFHHLELETSQYRLADGDYIIMVTDGVLENLIGEDKEDQFSRLISAQMVRNPQELAVRLMECVLEECGEAADDDMTIYVGGIWQKG